MTTGRISGDSVPSWDESEARASHAEWQRMENRRQWVWILGCAAVAAVVLVSALLLLNGGEVV
ncbi:hypothetical protein MED01_002313 [Micromonospora sp. MED01]|uniref:hypothetical protein n=1 Tax=Micromonospora alfalfae TaxID=2911212 RepID=UPI001EE8465F|nr:hypothetical protein [Micromonospora alfalfae]MCG5464148.1 hypothetical protein [Micromonospora alfalfae]